MIKTVDATITLKDLGELMSKINLEPKFQRNEVWSRRMQSELFTSIVEGISLPKIYLRRGKNGRFAVIDGKQRLIAKASVLKGNIKPMGYEWTYKTMPADMRKQVDKFPVSVVYCDGSDAEIRTLFKRLNSGKPLTINEKNHADCERAIYPVITALQDHEIVNVLDIPTRRYQHEQWLNQCCALMWQAMSTGSVCDTIGNRYPFTKLETGGQKNKLEGNVKRILDNMESHLSPFVGTEEVEGLPPAKTPHYTELFWAYYYMDKNNVDLATVNGKEFMTKLFKNREEKKNSEQYNKAFNDLLGKESVQVRIKVTEDFVKSSGVLKKPFALSL